MNIHELADLLGGTVNGCWINIAGPGHRSADRSLGIKFDSSAPGGFWVNSLSGDDVAACRRHVIALLEGASAERAYFPVPERQGSQSDERIKQALCLWNDALAAENSLVEKYLAWRGCVLPQTAATVLRFHPFCPFGTDRVPAMLGLMQNVMTDQPTGVHRTALNYGGRGKRDIPGGAKRMLGMASQAAVKLRSHNGVLGLAEGIESAMSASELSGLPVWALLSAGTIRRCPVIPGVKQLTIFADNDDAGMTAATECARRYAHSGIPAEICHPRREKADFNDLQQERTKCP